MSKHTQGDWYINGDKWATIQSKNTDEKIVVTYPSIAAINSTFITYEEFRANANLIAAAPKMLEALLKLQDVIERAASQNCVHAIETDEVNMINAAIVKAIQP